MNGKRIKEKFEQLQSITSLLEVLLKNSPNVVEPQYFERLFLLSKEVSGINYDICRQHLNKFMAKLFLSWKHGKTVKRSITELILNPWLLYIPDDQAVMAFAKCNQLSLEEYTKVTIKSLSSCKHEIMDPIHAMFSRKNYENSVKIDFAIRTLYFCFIHDYLPHIK